MKKKVAFILVFALIFSSVFIASPVSAEAADDYSIDIYDQSALLTEYSTAQIVAMYPAAAEHIAESIRSLDEDISLLDYDVEKDNLGALYFSVMCENPDIFYVLPNLVGTTTNLNTGKLVSIRPEYIFDRADIPARIYEFNTNVWNILGGIDRTWDEITKVRYIHDMLAQYVEYDVKYGEITNEDNELFLQQMRIYTAYGALCDFNAVCEGYSMAFKYLLQLIGIKSYYVQNNSARHSWIMVQIGNNYYHVDVSLDDPTYDTLGRAFHTSFLKSDRYFRTDGDDKHKEWVTNLHAVDTSCDNMWWNSVSTFIYRHDIYDYYVNQKYMNSIYAAVTRRNVNTGEQEVLIVNKSRWQVQGVENAHWEGAYSYITCDGTYFYFNDTSSVYRMYVGADKAEKIYTKPSSQQYDVYGLAFKLDGNLYVTFKPSPNDADNIVKIDLNVPTNPTNPTEPTDPTSPSESSSTTPTEPSSAATQPTTKATEPPTQATTKATEPRVATMKQSVTLYVNYATTITIAGMSNLKYSTSNKAIATVSSKGKITAKKKGKATVTIKGTGVVVKIYVTVKNPYLAKTKVTIKKGKTYTIKLKKGSGLVTFKSSNKKIATVSYKGKVKGIKKGKTTIIVKVVGIKLKCTVIVK